MSESEIDNNENPVIESEVVESKNNKPKDIERTIEPVVVKKGSFMGFLAFAFSLAALGLSSYMYYLDHYLVKENKENSRNNITNNLLRSSITALENESSQLNQLLTSTQQSNQQLGVQLNALQEQFSQSQSVKTQDNQTTIANEPFSQISKPFDDSEILQKIIDLQDKILLQSGMVEQLQNNLQTSNSQNTQSLVNLSSELQSQIKDQTNSLPAVSQTNQAKTIAESWLQEAYIQLDINGNIAKTQDFINRAIKQMSQLTGMRYGRLSDELATFSQQLNNIDQPNVKSLKSQINQLSLATSKLEFIHGELVKPENKQTSWFDNLISIKKIDQSQQPKLTKSEQVTIGNVINSHYQMLQLALMAGNQQLWLSEIKQIQNLLTLNFADNAKQINQKLSELTTVNLNPGLPSLEPFLQQFKSINLANENE